MNVLKQRVDLEKKNLSNILDENAKMKQQIKVMNEYKTDKIKDLEEKMSKWTFI